MERRHAKAYREINNAIAQQDMFDDKTNKLAKARNDAIDDYPDTITLKRTYSTHCQSCGKSHISENIRDHVSPVYKVVYSIGVGDNLVCLKCAILSGHPYEPRIYKEGE